MMVAGGDWLDALARRAAGNKTPKPEATATAFGERFSRATALKLAVAGVASLSFGLWRVGPADALDFGQCTAKCLADHEANLERRLAACDSVFGSDFIRKAPFWRSIARILVLPGTMVGPVLGGVCSLKEAAVNRASQDNCYRRCEETCGGRKLQSLQGSSETCEPTPPPKPESPKPPPAPNHTEDPCWSCIEAGGSCCGPFTGDPNTGTFTPCACATPGVGCDAYGCGG